KGEAETGHAHWLHQGKWAAAAVVLLVLATGWFALSRPSRMPTAPSRTATAQPAPPALPGQNPGAPTPGRAPKDVVNEVSPSVVRVNVLDASSRLIDAVSGVVIEPGVIITNCHVAIGGTTLNVKGRSDARPAIVQVADEQLNLCRLAAPGLDAPAATSGRARSLRPGQHVLAVGAPVGPEASMRDGIVTALAQVDHGTVIETTVLIPSGWSGGGLFDFSGHLVGIATAYHPYGPKLN